MQALILAVFKNFSRLILIITSKIQILVKNHFNNHNQFQKIKHCVVQLYKYFLHITVYFQVYFINRPFPGNRVFRLFYFVPPYNPHFKKPVVRPWNLPYHKNKPIWTSASIFPRSLHNPKMDVFHNNNNNNQGWIYDLKIGKYACTYELKSV